MTSFFSVPQVYQNTTSPIHVTVPYCVIILCVTCALKCNNVRRGEATKAPISVLLNNAAFKSRNYIDGKYGNLINSFLAENCCCVNCACKTACAI